MMRPQFVREQISDLDLEERHVQNMIQMLSPAAGRWTNQLDLQKLLLPPDPRYRDRVSFWILSQQPTE